MNQQCLKVMQEECNKPLFMNCYTLTKALFKSHSFLIYNLQDLLYFDFELFYKLQKFIPGKSLMMKLFRMAASKYRQNFYWAGQHWHFYKMKLKYIHLYTQLFNKEVYILTFILSEVTCNALVIRYKSTTMCFWLE